MCGGGEPPGTVRRPRGQELGAGEPSGGLRDAVEIRVPAPCPPTRSGRRVTFARRPNMVGAERQPPLPLRPSGPALWASDAGRGQSRCPASPRHSALGAGAPESPGEASASAQGPDVAAGASTGPRGLGSLATLGPSPCRSREGKEASSLSPEPGLCSGTR